MTVDELAAIVADMLTVLERVVADIGLADRFPDDAEKVRGSFDAARSALGMEPADD